MGAQAAKTLEVARYVAKLRALERVETNAVKRRVFWIARWACMLYHEVLRDNVKIRAESLAYLSLFSLLPILAGCFFIFTVLAQFGMVQDAMQGLLGTFLSSIPPEHREFVNEYVVKFQTSYLQTIQEKSGTIGVFALFILAYVGLQAFSNIDHTLNDIWGSDNYRPFVEKARNFIVVTVVAPLILTAGYSIPLILQKIPVTRFVLDNLPVLKVLLSYLIPTTLLFITFYVMYRYIPVVRVKWKAAFYGSVFATVALEVTNILLKVYFSFFSNTAYGKLAAVPLIAFWLFVVWIIIILGAEVSFLVENEHDVLSRADQSPTFSDARGMVAALTSLNAAFCNGKGAVDWDALLVTSGVGAESLRKIMEFLVKRGWAAEVHSETTANDTRMFLPGKDLSSLEVSTVLADYLQVDSPTKDSVKTPWAKEWHTSLSSWLDSFDGQTIRDMTKISVSNQKEK